MRQKISMCITCCGRLRQLRRTLPRNLIDNADDPNLEFVLVDYSSRDGLEEWVSSRLRSHLKSGRLVYAKVEGERFYNSPRSKNIAHRLATGSILVDLNADTWGPPAICSKIREVVAPGSYARCMMPSTLGLIAMTRQDFFFLGGYDERLSEGYGYDDDSLSHRAEAAGMKAFVIPDDLCNCIHHGNRLRVANMADKNIVKTARGNAELTIRDINAGQFVANVGKSWGCAEVELNFSGKIILG